MRLWSIHPEYLDTKGLVALWREGLLARKVLEGKTKGYVNHPQLLRFKKTRQPLQSIDAYLEAVATEGERRGYTFDRKKITFKQKVPKIPVTDGQILHEIDHLKKKIKIRNTKKIIELPVKYAKIHPLFKRTIGRVEQWEKVTDGLASFPYDLDFKKIDFRKNPELYRVGVGEQGVLMVEPYKSEILPFWRFRNSKVAKTSATKIYKLFKEYKISRDFVGMDMAKKFLQMGFTRSRRYANHRSGRKYDKEGNTIKQEKDWATNDKAKSAAIFYEYYLKAKNDREYRKMKEDRITE